MISTTRIGTLCLLIFLGNFLATSQALDLKAVMPTRRQIIVSIPTMYTAVVLTDGRQQKTGGTANAFSLLEPNQDRRQLDLCLVNLLRLQYWATSLSKKLQEFENDQEEMKKAYLEARLASKVIVAEKKKISGGANANVFMVKGFQVKGCLEDLKFYVDRTSKRQIAEYSDDLLEALASIVEFDGLETTQDDSPRSTLTLQMYTPQKAVFVRRMLGERVVPLTEDILRLFGSDSKTRITSYVQEFYPNEALAVQEKQKDTDALATAKTQTE